MINSFKDLIVWQKAIDVSVNIYEVTSKFPTVEKFVLSGQLRRAANSISLNIAEGHSRNYLKAYINHLNISRGSTNELLSGLYLAQKLNFIDLEKYRILENKIDEIAKMLNVLIKKLALKLNEKTILNHSDNHPLTPKS